MNRRLKIIIYAVLIVIAIICMACLIKIEIKRKMKEKDLLDAASNIIAKSIEPNNEERIIEQDVFSIEKLSKDKDVIGKLKIPSIDVEAPIKEGTSDDVLKEAVGHFSSTCYWNGNICLASHNRGTYAHYFQKLDKLREGDEIVYETKLGKKIYTVSNVIEISEYDISLLNNTNYNCLTLITCIKNKPDKRLCVRAIENR